MTTDDGPLPRWNYRRRAVGAIVCFGPVALLVTSLVVGLVSGRESTMGLGQLIGGGIFLLALPALNCYLTFIRPQLYGEREGYRYISGIPLVGMLLVVVFCGWYFFGDWRMATVGLVALSLDTGGLPWFLLATWRDHSLWDA